MKRVSKNIISDTYQMILKNFADQPRLFPAILDAMTFGASKTLREMGASDKMIAQLGKNGNDIGRISKLTRAKFADRTLDAAQKKIIDDHIRKNLGISFSRTMRNRFILGRC